MQVVKFHATFVRHGVCDDAPAKEKARERSMTGSHRSARECSPHPAT